MPRTPRATNIVPHTKYQKFQQWYGPIPASDKDDLHMIRSRMLQGLYRGKKLPGTYCNYVLEDSSFINFMRNTRLEADALKELEGIERRGRLTKRGRLIHNLLSSQPLAFNLFLPLKWDLRAATRIIRELLPCLSIDRVSDIKMEYVPGDGEAPSERKVNLDHSCFDAYVEYRDKNDTTCGIGIEVKYTESFSRTDFRRTKGEKKERYLRAIGKYVAHFFAEHADLYLSPKFNQLFRNQLLGQEAMDKNLEMGGCVVGIIFSKEDTKCRDAINQFGRLLKAPETFLPITVEQFLESAIRHYGSSPDQKSLYEEMQRRYCNYDQLRDYL